MSGMTGRCAVLNKLERTWGTALLALYVTVLVSAVNGWGWREWLHQLAEMVIYTGR